VGYEIDYMAVGEGERCGDAIALRLGNLNGTRAEQRVMVIDGGTKQSGSDLVQHIRRYYNTDRIDTVVSTHPDSDHISGLTVVLESLAVSQLLMHRPWEHSREVRSLLSSGEISHLKISDKLRRSLESACELEQLAKKLRIPIEEPFAGMGTPDGSVTILGPSREYYEAMVCDFRGAPGTPTSFLEILQRAAQTGGEIAARVLESMAIETLDDCGETSAENNSSAIVLIRDSGRALLFTGDAGIPALTQAADHAISIGVDLGSLVLLDVPHHGSRRNVGPTLLNRIRATTSYISAAPDGEPKHPSRRVVNALIRRGSTVYSTRGKVLCHYFNAPNRGWGPAFPLEFSPMVED